MENNNCGDLIKMDKIEYILMFHMVYIQY